MNLFVSLVVFIIAINMADSATPNYKGCEFYLDKMTYLYGQHFPRSNAVFKDPGSQGVEGFFLFLRQPGDLVVIMDRSEGFSAFFFYLMQRPFMEFILQNHVVISENHTRLAIMTFARDLTLLFDGISYDSDLDKCALFQDRGPWSEALYDRSPGVSEGTYIDQALNKAFDILTNPARNVPRAILVVTDGSWNSDRNPRIEHVMLLIKNAGIEVYSMMSGVYGISQYGNVKDVATAKDHYAEESAWVSAALSLKPALKWFTPEEPWTCSNDSCCHPVVGNVTDENPGNCRRYRCQNGGLCVDGSGVATCLCRLGFHGDECQHSVDDCLQDACPQETTCEDSHHRYTCTCPNKTEECLVIVKDLCGFIPGKFKNVPVSTGKNNELSNHLENGTVPTWPKGSTWGSTTIHQYHFISINAIVAIVCVCVLFFFIFLGVAVCIFVRRNPAYRERGKQCMCCSKPPPEVTSSSNALHPIASVSMETCPGAVANPSHEVEELPPKLGLKEEEDTSDVYRSPASARGSGNQASGSTVPTISESMAESMMSKPPPYSSLYEGTSRPKKNRRDSQQPLLAPASPDSPMTPDLYPGGFDFAQTSDLDQSLNPRGDPSGLDIAHDDPDLENNNISPECQPPSSDAFDISNFLDLPINNDVNYDYSTASDQL